MTNPLRIIFAGTPDFAAASLLALLKSHHQVVAVYTQPDRPAGRGRQLAESPVKKLAREYDIPVYQPASLKNNNEQTQLEALNADLMVVAAYGLILPPMVLDIPKYGCINVHASLLPRWRGAAPIQHAILAGDSQTGVTIMQMDAGLDTGDMLHKVFYAIQPDDTGSALHDQLAELGAKALIETLSDLPTYQAQALAQQEDEANYAHKLTKQQADMDWQLSANQLDRQVRAFNAWPVAFSTINGARVRIWQSQPLATQSDKQPGTILEASAEGIDVACGEGVLRLQTIQLAGAKAMPVAEVLKGKGSMFSPGLQFLNSSS